MTQRFVSTNGGQVNRLCGTSITLLLAFFFITSGMVVPMGARGEQGAPVGIGDRSTSGDWIIEGGDDIEHSYPAPYRIVVNGNLTIESGGKLTLNGGLVTPLILKIRGNLTIEENGVLICNNVDLRMEMEEHGQYSIFVHGEMGIYNSTRITPHNPEMGYKFEVTNHFEAVNSVIEGIWGERPIFDNYTANLSDGNWVGPIYENITTGNITDWNLSDVLNLTGDAPGYVSALMLETGGMVLKNSARARLQGSFVQGCFSTAIYMQEGSTLEVVNGSSIISNKNVGIYLNGLEGSNRLWINDSAVSMNGFHGVSSYWRNNIFIARSIISGNVGINIALDQSNAAIYNTSIIGGLIGIVAYDITDDYGFTGYTITVVNSTIAENMVFGIFLDGSRCPHMYFESNTIRLNHGTGVGILQSGIDGGEAVFRNNVIAQTRKSAPESLDPYWDILYGYHVLPGNGFLLAQARVTLEENDIYLNDASGVKAIPAILWGYSLYFPDMRTRLFMNRNNVTNHFLGNGLYMSTAPIAGYTSAVASLEDNYFSNNAAGIYMYRDGDDLTLTSKRDQIFSSFDAGIMINDVPETSAMVVSPGFGGKFSFIDTEIDGGPYGLYSTETEEILLQGASIKNCGTGIHFLNQTFGSKTRIIDTSISDVTTGLESEVSLANMLLSEVDFANFTTGLFLRGPYHPPYTPLETLIEDCTFVNEMDDPDDVVGTGVSIYNAGSISLNRIEMVNLFRGFEVENISNPLSPPKVYNTTFSANTNTTVHLQNNGTMELYAISTPRNKVDVVDEDSELRLFVYLDIHVIDSWEDPFVGAEIRVFNPATGEKVFDDVTGETGKLLWVPVNREIWKNENDTLYENYVVNASGFGEDREYFRDVNVSILPLSKTTFLVQINLNTPPFLETPIPIQYIDRMRDGESYRSDLHLIDYFSDYETPHNLGFSWSSSSVDYIRLNIRRSPWSQVEYFVSDYWYGVANIVVKANDGLDSVEANYTLVVEYVNFGPILKKSFPQISMEESTTYTGLDLIDYFGHRDNHELTFDYQVTTLSVHISSSGIVTITPPEGWTGVRTITFTATDQDGKTVSGEMDVAVYTTGPGPVFTVTISPAPTASVLAGQDMVFSAQAYDQFGVLLSDSAADFIWENATVGIFNKAIHGVYNVTARYEGLYSSPTVVTVEEEVIPPEEQHPILLESLPAFSGYKNTPMWEVLDLSEYFYHPTSNLSYTVSNHPEIDVWINDTIVSFIPSVDWIGRKTVTFTATAVDNGLTTNGHCTITIREIHIPPTLLSPLPDIELDQGETRNIDLNEHFTGTDLSYSFTQDGTLTISITGTTLRITAPMQTWGTVGITVKASSGSQYVSDHMNVTLLYENQPPVVSDVSVTIEEGETASRVVKLADHVVDETPSEQLIYVVIDAPYLTATIDSETYLTITPSQGYHGTTWVDIEVNDTELSSIMRVTVTVSPTPPAPNTPPTAVIRFSETTNTIWVNQQVTFYGEDSWDEEGPIVNYLWDFGDGTTSDATNPKHSYPSSGTYTCVLRVRDGKGLLDTEEFAVVVINREPVITGTSHETGRIEGKVGETINLWVEAWDPDGQILSYQWQSNGRNVGTRTSTYSFTPEEPGEYIIILTVTDGEDTATQEWTIIVAEQDTGPFRMGDALGGYLLHVMVLMAVILLTAYFLLKSKKHESVD